MMIFKKHEKACRRSGIALGGILMAAMLLTTGAQTAAAAEPKTVAEIALYQGPDREKLLIEGARKEGQLTFYTSNTLLGDIFVKEFEKKYPFIKVSAWRTGSKEILQRIVQENAAGRFLVDAIEASGAISMIHKAGILQEFYSPQLQFYPDEQKLKGKSGVYYCADIESYYVLGFNTKAVSPAEAPKVYKDLLDPRWNGKMTLAGEAIGARWIGLVLETMGRDFVEKLSRQNIRVQNISGGALAGMIASGEVPLSPTGSNFMIDNAKKKGAPVEWRPLEPVLTFTGCSGMSNKAPHPHAALLFLDYLHSKEGQAIVKTLGLNSPREETKFKRICLELKYTAVEEYEKKYGEWESLFQQLFIRKQF